MYQRQTAKHATYAKEEHGMLLLFPRFSKTLAHLKMMMFQYAGIGTALLAYVAQCYRVAYAKLDSFAEFFVLMCTAWWTKGCLTDF